MGRHDDRPPQGGRAFITHTPSLTIIICRWGCPGAVVVSNTTTTTQIFMRFMRFMRLRKPNARAATTDIHSQSTHSERGGSRWLVTSPVLV